MRIEHVGLWTADLERTRQFYETYFGAVAGERYENRVKQFASYFLTFPDGGARLELMTKTGLVSQPSNGQGYDHVAVSVGSEAKVNELVDRLRTDGYTLVDGPRWTGDGYFEAVVLEGNGLRIEITI
jgi:lactoylglutathione lyase